MQSQHKCFLHKASWEPQGGYAGSGLEFLSCLFTLLPHLKCELRELLLCGMKCCLILELKVNSDSLLEKRIGGRRIGGRERGGERPELLKLWACGWAQALVLILCHGNPEHISTCYIELTITNSICVVILRYYLLCLYSAG